MNGNSQANLTAPSSGTYAGILFFGDRDNSGGDNKINGNNASLLTGYMYFPSQNIDYQGNFSGIDGCTRVIASTITFTGSSTIDDTEDCSDYGIGDVPVLQVISLKE
jgi:hypothetical protein